MDKIHIKTELLREQLELYDNGMHFQELIVYNNELVEGIGSESIHVSNLVDEYTTDNKGNVVTVKHKSHVDVCGTEFELDVTI
jgi:hypothetical protein